MGLIDIASLAKWPALIAGGLLLLWIVYRVIKNSGKREARQEVANEIQGKTIDDAERRIAIENETKKRSPEEVARDIGTDGTGELR